MKFQLISKIDKEFILNKISEEAIFTYYLGEEVKTGKLYCSKLRTDNNPTCGFYRAKNGTLIYHDFATNDHYDCFNFVMKLYGLKYYPALKLIAKDFGLIESNKSSPNILEFVNNTPKVKASKPAKIQIEVQPFTSEELKWWGKYEITPDILKKFKIYSCKNVFLNDNLFASSNPNIMIFGYYGYKKNKLELWRIYFPQRKEYRFLTNWPSTKIQGFDQLPKTGKVLVITKSLKDVACLYSFNIPAIAPNSETIFISDNILNQLKERFKKIIVLWDNDLPGIKNMNKIKKSHPELIYCWLPRNKAKDFSDLVAKLGRKEVLKLLHTWIKILLLKFNKK